MKKEFCRDDSCREEDLIVLQDRIAKAMEAGIEDDTLDEDTFTSWMEEAGRKRKRRRRGYTALAACLVAVCFGAAELTGILNFGDPYAVAGNREPITKEEDGNAVIKNNDVGTAENPGTRKIVITDWAQIETVKKKYPDLLIPGYVPEGYEFEELTVEKNDLFQKYEYRYVNGQEEVYITQITENDSFIINEFDYKRESKRGKIYFKEDLGKRGSCLIEKNIVSIQGNLNDNVVVGIIENMK